MSTTIDKPLILEVARLRPGRAVTLQSQAGSSTDIGGAFSETGGDLSGAAVGGVTSLALLDRH